MQYVAGTGTGDSPTVTIPESATIVSMRFETEFGSGVPNQLLIHYRTNAGLQSERIVANSNVPVYTAYINGNSISLQISAYTTIGTTYYCIAYI